MPKQESFFTGVLAAILVTLLLVLSIYVSYWNAQHNVRPAWQKKR
jgi:hypothetical protein